MSKKKVLIFGMTAGYGGVESFVMNYARNINGNEIELDFLAYNTPPAYEKEISKMGCKIHIVTGRGKNPLKCAKEIQNIIKNGNYDAVWSNLCYLSDILVLKYAKRYNIPVRIVHSHNSVNMSGKLNGMLHKINKKIIGKYATDFWTCSDLAGEFFYTDKIRQSEKYKTIPNAVDTEKFSFDIDARKLKRKELKIENRLVIGNVGRLHFQKNHTFLLDVFKEVLAENPNCVLLLIGDGDAELCANLESKCKKLKISDRVLFLGRRNDINELMSAMDIFVMPSLFEGFPVALVEALSSNLPCFAASTITKEIKPLGNIEYIDLKEPASKWARHILNAETNAHRDVLSNVKNAGYDIHDQAKEMINVFIN